MRRELAKYLADSPCPLRVNHSAACRQVHQVQTTVEPAQAPPAGAQQLMQVADHFSNVNSSCHLPSSAKVLALLAAAGADDATVEQAAQARPAGAQRGSSRGRVQGWDEEAPASLPPIC